MPGASSVRVRGRRRRRALSAEVGWRRGGERLGIRHYLPTIVTLPGDAVGIAASKAGNLEGAGSYIALGELYERQGKDGEAAAAYEKALALSPTREERIRAQARLAVLAADRDFVPPTARTPRR